MDGDDGKGNSVLYLTGRKYSMRRGSASASTVPSEKPTFHKRTLVKLNPHRPFNQVGRPWTCSGLSPWRLWTSDAALGKYAEWVLRRIGNENQFPGRNPAGPSGGPVDAKATFQAESTRGAIDHLKISGGMGIYSQLFLDVGFVVNAGAL
jgi:hypothetical protein